MPLNIGDQAPDFTLPSTEGSSLQLSKQLAGKSCILYFYPKDFTQGCTAESCDFRDHWPVFEGLSIPVYGISRDGMESHHRFRAEHKLPFHLLSDQKGDTIRAYKAMLPLVGIPNRVTYLLDSEHRIKAVYESLFGARNHIKEMLQQIGVPSSGSIQHQ